MTTTEIVELPSGTIVMATFQEIETTEQYECWGFNCTLSDIDRELMSIHDVETDQDLSDDIEAFQWVEDNYC